jgi:U3 small nucleolar RNA-associated protein 14
MDVLSVKNPEPEKACSCSLLGQVDKHPTEKGLPSCLVKDHEVTKRNREEALKRRNDSKLKHITIYEHVDKKVKLYLIRYMPMLYVSVVYIKCVPIINNFFE